jgi:hypothetical protein
LVANVGKYVLLGLPLPSILRYDKVKVAGMGWKGVRSPITGKVESDLLI